MELFTENRIPELTFEQILEKSGLPQPDSTVSYGELAEMPAEPVMPVLRLDGSTIHNPTLIGGIIRDVEIRVQKNDGTNIFSLIKNGEDVGDVIIGDYSGGTGAKWDQSVGTLTIEGIINASSGTIGGFTIGATEMYGGIIKTAATVGAGSTGVIMDTDGLRGYDSVLGNTFELPTDGGAPTFSSGIINETIYEISTNAVLRTSSTVGDGSASSAGVLINNAGIYGCKANQTLAAANVKILTDGTIALTCSETDAITIQYGSDILLEHGGDIKFTSVTAPTACTGVLAGVAGNVDDGTHKYKITYVNATGETDLGAVSNTVTVADKTSDGQVSLTSIPTSPSSSVTSRRIYRSKAGTNNYYILTTIVNNTTTTYTDNTSDANLTGNKANFMGNNSFGKIIIDDIESLSLGVTNTFVGQGCGYSNISGYYNTFIGNSSGYYNVGGSSNTFVGRKSGESNTQGSSNAFLGSLAGYVNVTGNSNTFIGAYAGRDNQAGDNNVCVGQQSGYRLNPTGKAITAFSDYSGTVAGTIRATSVGHGLTGTVNNIKISGTNNYDGVETITVIDVDSFYFTDTWVADDIGFWSKYLEGISNVMIGPWAGYYNVIGDHNVFIGSQAGYYETGNDKLFIDNQTRTNEATSRTNSLLYGVFNSTPTSQILQLNAAVICGTNAALTTNATDGFLYIPSCAGAPTGTPTAYTGKVAMVFDTTNNKLYCYDSGWVDVT